MYMIQIFDKEVVHSVEIHLSTQTELLDFISLLSLSRNDHIFISVSYERSKQNK